MGNRMTTLTVTRDKLVGFCGSWLSGLATLIFENSSIPCENGQTVRALDRLVGDQTGGEESCVDNNHCVDNSKLAGYDLVYWEDDLGFVMGGFALYDDWLASKLPELVPGVPTEVVLPES